MADNNIKIKLTADGKQARNEIRLIDQDLQKLSNNNVSGKKDDKGGVDSASTTHAHSPEDKRASDQQRKSNDINTRILREMTLLRKELIKLNAHNSNDYSGGTQSKHQQSSNTSSSGGSFNNGGNQPPLSSGSNTSSSNNNSNSNNSSSSNNSSGNNASSSSSNTSSNRNNSRGSNASSSNNNSSGNNNSNNPPQQNNILSNLGGKIGKLALAMGSLSVLKGVYNKVSGYANSAENAESMAFRTYGTTLWYNGKNGYNTARYDTSKLGEEYGYNLQESMSVVDTIKSNAGLTSKENLKEDADAIMRTSKAFDVDTGALANAVSTTDRLGITKQGEYRKLTDVFAEGIVQSGMIDRADEQIQANQSIIDTLSSKTSRLSEDGMLNALQAQVALSQQNSALKGNAGASMVNAIASTASSNQDIKLLLGLGTDKYAGVEGELALERMINKDAVGATRQGLQNFLGYDANKHILDKIKGMNDEDLELFVRGSEDRSIKGDEQLSGYIRMIANATGKDADTVTDYVISDLKNIRDNKSGQDLKKDTSNGQRVIDRNLDNYKGSKVSIQEKKKVNEERAEQDTGDLLNRALAPLRNIYNNLSDGQRTALKIGGTVIGGAGGLFGLYNSFKGAQGLWNTAKGLFGAKGAGKTAETMAETVGSTAKTAGKTAETMAETARGASTVGETVGTTAKTASKLATASKFAKGAGIAGAVIDAGVTAVNVADAVEAGDNREASQETGALAGRLAGGFAGAKLGAMGGASAGAAIGSVVPIVGTAAGAVVGTVVGTVAGGIGGMLLGDKVGSYLGTSAYDAFSDNQRGTPEQEKEILRYYNEVQKIYNEKGGDEAQKYVNEVVAPQLNNIGISKSYTDDYEFDIGKNDFLQDVEDGAFGQELAASAKLDVEDKDAADIIRNSQSTEEARMKLLELQQQRSISVDEGSEVTSSEASTALTTNPQTGLAESEKLINADVQTKQPIVETINDTTADTTPVTINDILNEEQGVTATKENTEALKLNTESILRRQAMAGTATAVPTTTLQSSIEETEDSKSKGMNDEDLELFVKGSEDRLNKHILDKIKGMNDEDLKLFVKGSEDRSTATIQTGLEKSEKLINADVQTKQPVTDATTGTINDILNEEQGVTATKENTEALKLNTASILRQAVADTTTVTAAPTLTLQSSTEETEDSKSKGMLDKGNNSLIEAEHDTLGQELTASSNQDIKSLLGLGTDKYTGVEGELALDRMINKDAADIIRTSQSTEEPQMKLLEPQQQRSTSVDEGNEVIYSDASSEASTTNIQTGLEKSEKLLNTDVQTKQPITDTIIEEQGISALKENTEALKINTASVLDRAATTTVTSAPTTTLQSSIEETEDSKSKSMLDGLLGALNPFSSTPKSHAVGNDYIPYDNYLASLHKGEMILTKMEADKYRQGQAQSSTTSTNSSMSLNINVTGSVEGMTPNNQERIVQAVVAKIGSMSGLQGMLSNGFTRIQNM